MKKLLLFLLLPVLCFAGDQIKDTTSTGTFTQSGGGLFSITNSDLSLSKGSALGVFTSDSSNGNSGTETLFSAGTGDNVLSLRNTVNTQGKISAMTFRAYDNREKAAIGYGNRGSSTIAFPYTDAAFIETSKCFGESGPTFAPDFKIIQSHLNGASAIKWQERMRFTDQGSITIFKNADWGSQTSLVEFDAANGGVTFNLSASDPFTIINSNASGFETVTFGDGTNNRAAVGRGGASAIAPYTACLYLVSTGLPGSGVNEPIKLIQYDGVNTPPPVPFQIDVNGKTNIGVGATPLKRIKFGSTTLVAGTKVVTESTVSASSIIILTPQTLGTIIVPAALAVTARSNGVSFTITSAQVTDTSVVGWQILEP